MQYKEEKQHLSETERKELEEYIQKKEYLDVLSQVEEKLLPLPLRKEINKTGASKKRVVYSFPKEFNYLLKLLTYCLQEYDELFGENCYAFRRNYGVKDAVKCLKRQKELQNKYCLKADISNYFNSVDVPILLSKLSFLRENLLTRGAKSIKICTLLDKPDRRKVDLKVDYKGFVIPDEFVVGYGLDYAEKYRNLPDIGVLRPEIYAK